MNKSETPRTDAFLLKHGPNGIALIHWWRVIKEHARQLERELSAAKAALDVAMRERNDAMQAALNDMNARLRAEAALADAERKGREQGMREAVGIIQAEKVDADTTGEDADEAYNLAITHCTGAILSAIGEGK